MTLVVNLYGGPGTGKSTTAAAVFAGLKLEEYECELITEYAKRLVWMNDCTSLSDQIHVFGEQQRMFNVLSDQIDVIITDSPILLSIVYGENLRSPDQRIALDALILSTYETFDNMDIFLERHKKYVTAGRLETSYEAIVKDRVIGDMLTANHIWHQRIAAVPGVDKVIIDLIRQRLGGNQ